MHQHVVRLFFRSLAAITSLALVISAIVPVQAQVAPGAPPIIQDGLMYDPNYLLDDLELVDADSMSLQSIQTFLLAEPGTLANYQTSDIDGSTHTAAEIIYGAAHRASINPKFLLVTLQKEQSLVEDPNPTQKQYDWATGFAVCDSCSTDDPAIQKFKGFAVQVDRAAARQRYYLDHPFDFSIRVGLAYTIDGTIVVPANQATANLYTYTPHLSGNLHFWSIWQRYFARHYPDGSLLKDETSSDIWLLQNGQRRRFVSLATLFSDYDSKKIIAVSHQDIGRYDIGAPIRFPDYSLLRSPKGTVYLLVGNTKRGISSREVFRSLGFNPGEVIPVGWTDLATYTEGIPISQVAASPVGQLWQDKISGGVFEILDGQKHPIWAKDILRTRFTGETLKKVTPADLDKFPTGDPVPFRDGELVTATGDPAIYVISNGQKRPITSAAIFTALGYQWTNVIHTTSRALDAQPIGDPING